jgi:hypothetical protein
MPREGKFVERRLRSKRAVARRDYPLNSQHVGNAWRRGEEAGPCCHEFVIKPQRLSVIEVLAHVAAKCPQSLKSTKVPRYVTAGGNTDVFDFNSRLPQSSFSMRLLQTTGLFLALMSVGAAGFARRM